MAQRMYIPGKHALGRLWHTFMARQQKNTLDGMRPGNGPRWLIVYCSDFKCSHSVVIDAAQRDDDVRLSDLEPQFTCKACGRRGADVRPLFEKAAMGTVAG